MQRAILKKILQTTPHETTAVQPLTSHLKNHPSKKNTRNYACETRTDSQVMFFCGPLHMDAPVLAD